MATLNDVTITTAEQVRTLLSTLTPEQKQALALRTDYSVELRLKIGRGSAIGSVIMNASEKYEEQEGEWVEVAQKGEGVVALPTELVLFLAGAALQNEAAQQIIYQYFGEIPNIVAP
jgi:hypothetical protein